MMKNNLRFLLLFVVFGLSSIVYGQRRPCAVPTVTLIPTVTHATCFDMVGDISFSITAPDGAYVNSLKLIDEQGGTAYDHGDGSLSGIATGLSVGMYRFSGSVVVEYKCDGLGYITSVEIDQNVWLGIETVWTEKIDMISSPNSYSAKRNATTATYGGVRSSNGISSGDGWVEMSATFGNTTDNRVFLIVGETNPLGVFDPAAAGLQHIEFYKGSAGNGIRVRYINSGNVWIGGISSDPNDKVRLVRTGTTLTIQLNDNPSTVFTFPQTYSGPMNIAVRTLATDDGCVDVVSSFPCGTPKMFASLKYKLDGFYHIMDDGKIRFVFDQEYDADDLTFNIYNHMDVLVKDQSDFPTLATTNGANYLTIDVSDDTHCIGRGFFYLEVINSKKEKMYLRFLNDYQNPACTDYISNENPPTE